MNDSDSGLEVVDLLGDTEFAERQRRSRHLSTPVDGVTRIARSFVEAPHTVLQELVQSAIDLCGADSVGISLEFGDSTEERYCEWVATAGQYAKLQHSVFPRELSAARICMERGRPQHLRVAKQVFDAIKVPAAPVTDGFLLPLRIGQRKGVIFIVAHGRREAFDEDDLRIMRILADMVVMGVRQQESIPPPTLAARLSNDEDTRTLARKFDKSLQGMKAALHVAEWSETTPKVKLITGEMGVHLDKLAVLVHRLMQSSEPVRPN